MEPRASRRRVLRTVPVVAGLAGCPSSPDGPGFAATFERGLGDWERNADVAGDWRIARSTERAASGGASVRFRVDGRGAAWLARSISIRPGRAYRLRMWARAWSPTRRDADVPADVVMAAAREAPTGESSFPSRGENSSNGGVVEAGGLRQALHREDGWLTYSFVWLTPTLEDERLHVAVGVATLRPGASAYFVDDVELSVRPR